MGLYDQNQVVNDLLSQQEAQGPAPAFQPAPPEQPLNTTDTRQLVARSGEQNNWFINLLHNGIGDITKSDPSFNPADYISDTEYAHYPDYFVNADNMNDINEGIRKVNELKEYQELASRSPSTAFWSGLAWGAADPALAIPGFGSIRAAKVAQTGARVLTTAAETAAITGAVVAGEQGVLQTNQPERTAEEAGFNIASASVVGAAFGGLVGAIAPERVPTLTEFPEMKPQGTVVGTPTVMDSPTMTTVVDSPYRYNIEGPKPVEDYMANVEANNYIHKNTVIPQGTAVYDHTIGDYGTVVNRYENGVDLQLANGETVRRSNEALAMFSPSDIREKAFEARMQDSQKIANYTMQKSFDVMDDANPVSSNYLSADQKLGTPEYYSLEDDAARFDAGDELDAAKFTLSPDEIKPVNDKDIAEALKPTGTGDEAEGGSAGAAYVSRDARIANMPNWVIKATSVPGLMPASLEGMSSSSGIVRDFTSRIFNMHYPLEYNKGIGGKATPTSLESKTTLDILESLDFTKAVNGAYMRYLKVDPNSFGAEAQALLRGKGRNYLSSKDFDAEVIRAMNYGDKHTIPEIQEAAQYTRNLINQASERLKKIGFDFADDPNYFKRVYDVPAIMNRRMDFEQDLIKNLVNKNKAIITYKSGEKIYTTPGTYDARTKQTDWVPQKGQELVEVKVQEPMTIEEARERAVEITDDILKLGDKSLALGDIDRLSFSINSDSMKPRSLMLDYNSMDRWFVKDFKDIVHQYLASTSRAVRYRELLDDMGVDKLQDLRMLIRDEFDNNIAIIKNNKNLAQKKKDSMIARLSKEAQKAQKLFNDISAISLGQYKKRTTADPFWRMTNQYNAMRLLGGVVVSSLSDPLTMFIKNSIPNAVWNGWLGELRRVLSLTNGLKKQDFRDAMTAVQGEIDDGIRFLMNPDFSTSVSRGPAEKLMQGTSQAFMKINLMQYWNNFWQRASHNLAESNILRITNKGDWNSLSKKDMEYLREIGIDEADFRGIKTMQSKYGNDIRGTHISNSRMWSDQNAKNKFNTAIMLEVRKSPLLTEHGDIPIWFQKSEARKSMFLFKGYTSAATSKILMSALARRNGQALTGVMGLIMGGAVSWILAQKLKGKKDSEIDMSINNLIFQGLNRSGVLGLLADPFFQVGYAKDSTKKYGKDAWITEPMSYIMGPNASVLSTAYNAIIRSGKDNNGQSMMDKKTEYGLKQLIPGQNLFYLSGGKK